MYNPESINNPESERMLDWFEQTTERMAHAHGQNVGRLATELSLAHYALETADIQVERLGDMIAELTYIAHHDSLTGLYNRAGLIEAGEEQLAMNPNVAVLFVDLDKFKLVNDTLGHAAGDKLLQTAAATISQNVRGDDVVGRNGGDEFVVVADTTPRDDDDTSTTLERVQGMAERIQTAYTDLTGESMSIGWVLQNPDQPASLEEMLASADNVMYTHKRQQHTPVE